MNVLTEVGWGQSLPLRDQKCWPHKGFVISILSAISVQVFQAAFVEHWQLQGQLGTKKELLMNGAGLDFYGASLSCQAGHSLTRKTAFSFALTFQDGVPQFVRPPLMKLFVEYDTALHTSTCIIHRKTLGHLDRLKTLWFQLRSLCRHFNDPSRPAGRGDDLCFQSAGSYRVVWPRVLKFTQKMWKLQFCDWLKKCHDECLHPKL